MTTPEQLWRFVGRADVFAVQSPNGSYFPERRPLTTEDLAEHLAGFWSLGTYVIDPDADSSCHFIVFDLDTFDPELLGVLQECVEKLVDSTAPFGYEEYPMLMLEASGGKGYHIWLFLDEVVEAWRLRSWLNEEFWPRWNERTNSLPLEVFPKQDVVEEGRYGNLVKVPFGIHAKSGNRSELLPGIHGWVSEVSNIRGLSEALIPNDPDRKPKAREAITTDTPTGILLADGPVSRFLQGETASGERNLTFHAFFTWTAWNLHLPSDLAWEWAQRLNEALADPEDDEQGMQRTLESAYSRPPADAANPRPPRGTPGGGTGYRRTSRDDRLAAVRARRGASA